jgi:UDP-N-acetylmuramoylalanine--D-glutamate ligase
MPTTMTEPTTDPRLEWRGKRVAVIGMARSGRAVAGLLARHGAAVRAADQKTAEALGLDPAALVSQGIEPRLGGHDPRDLDGIEVAVVSPGIPKTAPILVEARRRGIPFLSELEVAARFARAPIAAVTGTNGKSTTVTVLGELIRALDRPAAVAGNVGTALSEVVESVPPEGALVVEVSSYQLEDVERFHPRAAAILNVTPDHLDRYDSMRHYADTKLRVFDRQGPDDTAVLPVGDPWLEPTASRLTARLLRFAVEAPVAEGAVAEGGRLIWRAGGTEHEVLPLEELPLRGPHNHANVAAALCLLDGLGLDVLDPRVAAALRTLRGLPHRLEPVGEIEGVRFINDSKATNPESLEVALRSFNEPVVLIAGGRPKESDYARLVPLIRDRVAAIVLIGEAAPRLESVWRGAGVPTTLGGTDFEASVRAAHALARPRGLVVLLSPGCASFDMFRDFEDRGDRFRTLVRAWGGVR